MRELSAEEADLLARSTKKIKASRIEHGGRGGDLSDRPPKLSFKDSLIGARNPVMDRYNKFGSMGFE
ncbi:hypothetical protein COLO4_24929 [Corchorus olitorius]|uniref:Uncharacterized protein n=1 Tax=Corchorus olitorius TaxID=93759 RepID=A0A1R3I5V1_9ROSI|nr:hypothetical protein COLO4_24929 [Corchorus olitorius]